MRKGYDYLNNYNKRKVTEKRGFHHFDRSLKKSIPVAKVKEYLNRIADGQENRNILVKTNDDGYKIKSYRTRLVL